MAVGESKDRSCGKPRLQDITDKILVLPTMSEGILNKFILKAPVNSKRRAFTSIIIKLLSTVIIWMKYFDKLFESKTFFCQKNVRRKLLFCSLDCASSQHHDPVHKLLCTKRVGSGGEEKSKKSPLPLPRLLASILSSQFEPEVTLLRT